MNRKKRQPKNHREALLALSLVHRLGVQRIRLLLQHVDHPAEVFMLSEGELTQINGIGSGIADTIRSFNNWEKVDVVLEKTQKIGAQILTYYDELYPPMLREIYDPPILLWVKGNPKVLTDAGVAIVGTRRATRYGLETACKFGKQLAQKGLTIVSGLALGVDAAAHKATVKAGGKTIAVLGSGLDVIYPRKHVGLANEIVETGGAVISEFPLGTSPDAGNFPERNRIVSGLTLGTLVVESGLKGGSMITAQSALTQNREVFVVPHSLENVNGQGCNHLIKRAAGKLVQSVEDILEELPQYKIEQQAHQSPIKSKSNWKSLELDEESRNICQLLKGEAMHIDDMSEALGKASHELLPKLLELEMQDCVRQTAGKNFELV